MRKAVAIALVISCAVVSVCGIVWLVDRYKDELWSFYDEGFDAGIDYVMENMVIWSDPDWEMRPGENGERLYLLDETEQYDGTVLIYLDDEWFTIPLYVG